MRLDLTKTVATLVIVLFSAGVAQLVSPFAGGYTIDLSFVFRDWLVGQHPLGQASPTVIVAIDEETYRRDPFQGTPNAMWTPQIGKVLNAVVDGGAKVVGFDLILSTSVESIIHGYERDFQIALRKAANEGKVVLGMVQNQTQPIVPYRGFIIAAKGPDNLRDNNVTDDPDGNIRRMPISVLASKPDGSGYAPQPSIAMEVAARTMGATLTGDEKHGFRIGDYRIPGNDGKLLLNFSTGPGAIPIYSFADLYKCAEDGKTDYFTKNFKDKAVFLGVVLDIEDRKQASNRFVTSPEGDNLPDRCAIPPMEGLFKKNYTRAVVPGITIQATATNNVLLRNALSVVPVWSSVLMLAVLSAVVVGLSWLFAPLRAGIVLLGVAVIWTVICVLTFRSDVVMPMVEGWTAALLSYLLLVGVRFSVIDRDQRKIKQAFRLYLPEEMIDKMVSTSGSPQLGGETRHITIMFCDIAGFTNMSEGLDPHTLVALLNRYFTVMTEIIEKHDGFVDKYIGDAILAVFGAPYNRSDHARAAVDAALEMRAVLESDPTLLESASGRGSNRIGIATGPALIGNIGAPRRFNYTVIGDTVNLSSRLEGTNKQYGTAVLVSDITMQEVGKPEDFHEIDMVQVVGRVEATPLYEPLSPQRRDDPADQAYRAAYTEALALWRAGRFAEAAEAFAPLAPKSKAAATFQKRAAMFAVSPPDYAWTGVTAMTEK